MDARCLPDRSLLSKSGDGVGDRATPDDEEDEDEDDERVGPAEAAMTAAAAEKAGLSD